MSVVRLVYRGIEMLLTVPTHKLAARSGLAFLLVGRGWSHLFGRVVRVGRRSEWLIGS